MRIEWETTLAREGFELFLGVSSTWQGLGIFEPVIRLWDVRVSTTLPLPPTCWRSENWRSRQERGLCNSQSEFFPMFLLACGILGQAECHGQTPCAYESSWFPRLAVEVPEAGENENGLFCCFMRLTDGSGLLPISAGRPTWQGGCAVCSIPRKGVYSEDVCYPPTSLKL